MLRDGCAQVEKGGRVNGEHLLVHHEHVVSTTWPNGVDDEASWRRGQRGEREHRRASSENVPAIVGGTCFRDKGANMYHSSKAGDGQDDLSCGM